jgi:hypothetical protein
VGAPTPPPFNSNTVKTQNPETSKRRRVVGEMSKAEQVKTIMDQINSIHPTGIVQPPQPDLNIPTTPNPVPPSPAPPQAAQVATPPPAPQFIEDVVHPAAEEDYGIISPKDVVQVTGTESRIYGVIYVVGDIRGEDVHGYCVMPIAGEKRFVTEQYGRLTKIGVASVLSRTPCHADWLRQQ